MGEIYLGEITFSQQPWVAPSWKKKKIEWILKFLIMKKKQKKIEILKFLIKKKEKEKRLEMA